MVHTTARRSLLLTVCLLLGLTALGTTPSGTRRHQESRGVTVVPSIPPVSPDERRVALLKGWIASDCNDNEQLDGANMVRELHRVGHPRQSCATTQPARPSDSGHVRMRTACAGGRTGSRRGSTPTTLRKDAACATHLAGVVAALGDACSVGGDTSPRGGTPAGVRVALAMASSRRAAPCRVVAGLTAPCRARRPARRRRRASSRRWSRSPSG